MILNIYNGTTVSIILEGTTKKAQTFGLSFLRGDLTGVGAEHPKLTGTG